MRRSQKTALSFHALTIVQTIETAFNDLVVDALEVERGAVRLILSSREGSSKKPQPITIQRHKEVVDLLNDMDWALAPSDFFGPLTVIFPGYVVQESYHEFVKLRALVDFPLRNLAKNAGYQWDDKKGYWWRDIQLAHLEEHREGMKFSVHVLSTSVIKRPLIVPESEYKPTSIGAKAGRLLAAQRKTFAGPAKVMHLCPHCSNLFGARDYRSHVPHCPLNPRRRGRNSNKSQIDSPENDS